MSHSQLLPAAQATLDSWHQWLQTRDPLQLDALMSNEVVFRSPVAHTAYPGRQAIGLILTTVASVFENFVYHRQFVSADGQSVVLEFAAEVSGKTLKGIDMIRFDTDGKIVEFEVMVRPASGLQALGAEMAVRLAPYMAGRG